MVEPCGQVLYATIRLSGALAYTLLDTLLRAWLGLASSLTGADP
jgi:hypothetical protein